MAALAQAPVLWRASVRGREASDSEHLTAAAAWLLAAQRAAGGGGYAHSFHFLHGWQPAYPETTGYIIPTMRELHRRTGVEAYRESMIRTARWLASIQREDGSFADLNGRPQVFDTGQILIGLNDLARHASDVVDLNVLRRSAKWLRSVQESDGSFVRHAYNGRPHAYYARVGAALAAAGGILGDPSVREAGLANLRWTVAQQSANGFFRHLSFENEPPFLHTMVYAIEGLLDGAAETGEASFFDAAVAFAGRLRTVAEKRDGVLRSQYFDDCTVSNGEYCLTGVAQWAGVAFRLFRATKDDGWASQGRAALAFLKRRQIRCSDQRLDGGLPGSAPWHGRYMRAAIPNWGVKFFIDAILEAERCEAHHP